MTESTDFSNFDPAQWVDSGLVLPAKNALAGTFKAAVAGLALAFSVAGQTAWGTDEALVGGVSQVSMSERLKEQAGDEVPTGYWENLIGVLRTSSTVSSAELSEDLDEFA